MIELDIRLKDVKDIEKLVQITNNCDYDIDLMHGRYVIDGKSIMGIFTLNLGKPIRLVAHGDECSELIERLKEQNYLEVKNQL
jgi:phosphocarrier protein HPr